MPCENVINIIGTTPCNESVEWPKLWFSYCYMMVIHYLPSIQEELAIDLVEDRQNWVVSIKAILHKLNTVKVEHLALDIIFYSVR